MIRFGRIQFPTRTSLSSIDPFEAKSSGFQQIVTQVIAKRATAKRVRRENSQRKAGPNFEHFARDHVYVLSKVVKTSETGSGRSNRMKKINHENAIVRNDRQICVEKRRKCNVRGSEYVTSKQKWRDLF